MRNKWIAATVIALNAYFAPTALVADKANQQVSPEEMLNILSTSPAVGHLGYSSNYLFPVLLRQRQRFEIMSEPKDAVHVVRWTKEGLSHSLASLMNSEELKQHGKLAFLVETSEVLAFRSSGLRADYVVVYERAKTSDSELFADLMLAGAERVYLKEGNYKALESVFALVAKGYYASNPKAKEISVRADLNFNPQDISAEHGVLAATQLFSTQQNLRTLNPKVPFVFSYHEEFGKEVPFLASAPAKDTFSEGIASDFLPARNRVLALAEGRAHLQSADAIYFHDGFTLLMELEEGNIEFYLTYPKEYHSVISQKAFKLDVAINNRAKFPLPMFFRDLVELKHGQPAAHFEISRSDVAVRKRFLPFAVKAHFGLVMPKFGQPTFKYGWGTVQDVVAEQLTSRMAAAELLAAARLAAAKAEFKRVSLADIDSSDAVNRAYLQRWSDIPLAEIRGKAMHYLQEATTILEEELRRLKDETITNCHAIF